MEAWEKEEEEEEQNCAERPSNSSGGLCGSKSHRSGLMGKWLIGLTLDTGLLESRAGRRDSWDREGVAGT